MEGPSHRRPAMYTSLAPWWPLISPVEDYAEEAAEIGELLGSASIPVREVLELGSGGGNNAHHLSARFAMTLVDLSPEMLAVSRKLNPGCTHIEGDMRTVRLPAQVFDAVFVHDAVDYLLTVDDLAAMLATAVEHCRPGGVVVIVPDDITETFQPRTEHGGSDAPDGRGARYLEWTWDPDTDDDWTQTDYVIVLRNSKSQTRVVHDSHRLGLFSRDTWLDALAGAGLRPLVVTERTTEDRSPREIFVGHLPA